MSRAAGAAAGHFLRDGPIKSASVQAATIVRAAANARTAAAAGVPPPRSAHISGTALAVALQHCALRWLALREIEPAGGEVGSLRAQACLYAIHILRGEGAWLA